MRHVETSLAQRSTLNDLPAIPLEEAVALPRALLSSHRDAVPIDLLAKFLGDAPQSSTFQSLLGSAIGYGLVRTEHDGEMVRITEEGRALNFPSDDRAKLISRRRAVLTPPIMRAFFEQLGPDEFPPLPAACDRLMRLGVGIERVAQAVDTLRANHSFARLGAMLGRTRVDPSTMRTEKHVRAMPGVSGKNTDNNKHPGTLKRGDTVDVYRLSQRLGRGFTSEVWSANVDATVWGTELEKGDAVAIKIYNEHAQVARVKREFDIAKAHSPSACHSDPRVHARLPSAPQLPRDGVGAGYHAQGTRHKEMLAY